MKYIPTFEKFINEKLKESFNTFDLTKQQESDLEKILNKQGDVKYVKYGKAYTGQMYVLNSEVINFLSKIGVDKSISEVHFEKPAYAQLYDINWDKKTRHSVGIA